jgi:hypothetical protein
MSTFLRTVGFSGLVFGLFLSSYGYWSPSIREQTLIAGYVASQNKDAYEREHPGFRRVPNEDERADQLVSIIYGLGIALIGVGVVLISYKIKPIASANTA